MANVELGGCRAPHAVSAPPPRPALRRPPASRGRGGGRGGTGRAGRRPVQVSVGGTATGDVLAQAHAAAPAPHAVRPPQEPARTLTPGRTPGDSHQARLKPASRWSPIRERREARGQPTTREGTSSGTSNRRPRHLPSLRLPTPGMCNTTRTHAHTFTTPVASTPNHTDTLLISYQQPLFRTCSCPRTHLPLSEPTPGASPTLKTSSPPPPTTTAW
ncbi:hypothetical protein Pmani_035325 [Petrolisthes manimaculis]|uniref:Uncharacterized protein n=1 Tax=Petrolisthes manimaculis TaxID=1843537 RepID=A0AAE1TQM6_9EUCA|nr:hypothetical protein Pmani_035325 [Petrolisthes manimaculis]